MDWGLGNPNKTAALIAMLLIAVWLIAWVWRRGFWFSLIACTVLASYLMHTFSRGGIVAALCGLLPIAAFAPRPWPRVRLVTIVCSMAVVTVFATHLGTGRRLVQGVAADKSVSNRLLIWETAPRMIVDAPSGWGLGNSGNAYMQWYQPVDHPEGYRTLVNSHLTWLVEFGWLGRFLYLAGWCLAVSVCWPIRGSRWLAVCLGIWIAFGTAALFSSVAECTLLWILPLTSIVAALAWRLTHRSSTSFRWVFGIPVLIALSLCVLIFAFGKTSADHHVRRINESVEIGLGKRIAWILIDEKVMGRNYGKTWRRTQPGDQAVVFLRALPHVQDDSIPYLVLAGDLSQNDRNRAQEIVGKTSNLIAFNPRFTPDEIGIETGNARVSGAIGAFAQGSALQQWKSRLGGNLNEVAGAGEYMPSWASILRQRFSERTRTSFQ